MRLGTRPPLVTYLLTRLAPTSPHLGTYKSKHQSTPFLQNLKLGPKTVSRKAQKKL